jgi:hypothetical protein
VRLVTALDLALRLGIWRRPAKLVYARVLVHLFDHAPIRIKTACSGQACPSPGRHPEALLSKGLHCWLSDGGRSFSCTKDGVGSAGQSWVAGKTEVADAGFDPAFCVIRVRTQGKSDQPQIPASIGTVQV